MFFVPILFVWVINGQVNDICAESGNTPSFDSPFAHIPYLYGKISLLGFTNLKNQNITIIYTESQQIPNKLRVNDSGHYCFKTRGNGGNLSIELNGIEVLTKTIPSLGSAQLREDFEIANENLQNSLSPGVISTKFHYPPNPKTIELYKKTANAEAKNEPEKAIVLLKEIVTLDSVDFIAWAKLGTLYFNQDSLKEAYSAFRKCLELRIDYTPAWINVGKMRIYQKQFPAAIEIFKHALTLEPKSARIYQLLGEAYLQNKQGSLGAESLNKAIELDPIGMAELHLQLAHLYQLAKANNLATKEYKLFLAKMP
ncbi:MAG: tetratricopeptide repeat protein, partial [Acidobacteriota bacterium]